MPSKVDVSLVSRGESELFLLDSPFLTKECTLRASPQRSVPSPKSVLWVNSGLAQEYYSPCVRPPHT